MSPSFGRWEKESLERPTKAQGQLLVEGRAPEIFFLALLETCGWSEAVDVRTFGSIASGNLQAYLEILTQRAAFKEKVLRLGIIRDAEALPATSAFQSVQSALRGAQLPAPGMMNKLEGSPLSVGVFILPNCQDAGMLETLCLSAIAEIESTQPNGVLPCVDEFFACLNKRGKKPGNTTKARFAGYALASDVVDPQLGRAAQKGAIPWRAIAFDPLKDFLKGLAGK